MSSTEIVLALLTGLLLAALLVVLLRGRRYCYGYAFSGYILSQLIVNVAGVIAPDHFNDWMVWTWKEGTYAVLRLAIIAETVTLIFRVLPRARARAQMLILIAVAVVGVALSRPYDTHTSYRLARDIVTRMSYITIWSLIAILGLVAWYRVPLLRFHKAILHGLLWLLIAQFATVIGTARLGSHLMGNVYNLAQIPVISLWIVAALTEDTKGLGKDETAVIRYLQPWRKP